MQRLMKRDSAFDVFVTDVANIFNRPKLPKNWILKIAWVLDWPRSQVKIYKNY